MKIAIDSYTFHRYFGEVYDFQLPVNKKMNTMDFIQKSIDLGLDGASIELCFLENFKKDYLLKLKNMIEEYNLETILGWGHPDGLEGGTNWEALKDMKKQIETCKIMNIKTMRVVGSSLSFRNDPHGPQVKGIAKMLKEPIKMAEEVGIRLAIENHFDFVADEILEILDKINSDNMGVTFDTANALRIGEDPILFAEKLSNKIFATHIKDVKPLYGGNPQDWYYFASVPIGDGIIDFPKLIKTLLDNNYNGLFAVEIDYLHPDYSDEEESAAKSVTYLKKIREKL